MIRSSLGFTKNAVEAAPAPVELARCADDLGHGWVEEDREAKTETLTLALRLGGALGHRRQVFAARQMIQGHELQGPGPQDAHTVQLAAPGQHPAKAEIVGRGGHEPAGAGEVGPPARVGAGLWIVHELVARAAGAWSVVRGEAVDAGGGHAESSVYHAERAENALVQEAFEGHPADDLAQVADQVGGDAVDPARAGINLQRNLAQPRDHVRERERRVRASETGPAVQLADQRRRIAGDQS